MAENWRKKTYYDKRVLVDTERVLSPQFPATLICLDGAELEMLRNLTQYLHRRSTFAQGYTKAGYLSPTSDDWDTISSIVANLEEKLMGCDELETLLKDILTQLECVCLQTTGILEDREDTPLYTPATQEIVDQYFTAGGLQSVDDYSDDTTASIDRCAVAQLAFWQAWQFTNEILQPVAENTIDILLPAAMTVLAVSAGTVALAIPVGILLAALWKLIEVDVAGSMAAVTNSMWAYKDELTCAVWDGLGTDYREAESRAREVIDVMSGLSALDKVALRLLYAPWLIGLAEKAWDNQTAWAIANVEAGGCDDCDWTSTKTWTFPPCPGLLTGTFACTVAGHPGVRVSTDAITETFDIQSIASDVDAQFSITWYSAHPSGWTVGYCQLQYQDIGLVWHDIGGVTLTNNAGVGALNSMNETVEDITIPRNVLRLYVDGQAGQGEENPYPVELVTVDLVITET